MTRLSWRIWRHRATGTEATYVGVERDASGLTYALMTTGDGVTGRIDPLDLLNGSWIADGIHGTPVQLVDVPLDAVTKSRPEPHIVTPDGDLDPVLCEHCEMDDDGR